MSQQSGRANFCNDLDSLQSRRGLRHSFLASNSRAQGSLWRPIDGTGEDYIKTSISFAKFEADADASAPCTDGIATSSAMIPLREDSQCAAAKDVILLESDAQR
jgi:hypothetical protein